MPGTMQCRLHRGALAVLAIILTAAAGSAQASPVTAVGGYDHYAGPLGQNIDAVLGAVVLGAGGSDLMLAGVRYDDNLSGQGITVTGGVGVPLAPMTKLRINATRIIADETFRAWRARVGPQLSLPRGTSLSLWYAHYQDHLGGRSNGAIAEAAAPIVPKLSGRASASYATTSQGPPAVQGSVGLGWSVVSHLELSGELGLARNASGAAGTPGGGGPLGGLPILGGSNGGSSGGTVEQVDTTFLIGLRVTLP